MNFSQRMGLTPVQKALQLDSMTSELRNGLWNGLTDDRLWKHEKGLTGPLARGIWCEVLKNRRDELGYHLASSTDQIARQFFEAKWNVVCEIVEYAAKFANAVSNNRGTGKTAGLVREFNRVLQREGFGYRVIGDELTPITSAEELESIEAVLATADRFGPARTHIQSALSHLSNRDSPDYRNSVKEAISAVESVCKKLTGDQTTTLGATIKKLRDSGIELHPSFEIALSKMYGFTSDAGGIRHSLLSEPTIDFTDAKFMLVACSAFVNYLIGKSQTVS